MGATQTYRIEGKDRYLTAVEISKRGWPDGSDVVVLANGINYPDALSAAPLAKKHNAPILLSPKEKLNPDTAMEIKRLKARRVILVGGDSALSTNVLFELRMMGVEVSRISGANRYDTSLAVAQEVGMGQGILVVRGDRYQDAVGASAIAAGQGMPLILVSNNLTPEQEKALGNDQVSNAIFVGGDRDFSTRIFNLFPEWIWIKGSDAYERNVELVKEFERGLDLKDVYIATGRAFPDALAASALAAQGDNPVFLI
ncbi:MAG: cell wall-binding repeat-containing protein, partial [Desulfitobacterium sp.]|nr:cell wall-binding repeat-containing protein [Desulfitobacterium sp.]